MAGSRGERRALLFVIAAVAAVAVFMPLTAQQQYSTDLDSERLVRFTSRAAIEEFDGVTEKVDGFVLVNGAALDAETGGDGTEFYFEVDLGSIDTGIGLRNRHMRNNYLHVEDFPYAAFGGKITRAVPLSDGAYRLTVKGTLAIHGVERERTVTCNVRPAGEGYRVDCGFSVMLEDHDIKIPKIMFLKLNSEVTLEIGFTVVPTEGDA